MDPSMTKWRPLKNLPTMNLKQTNGNRVHLLSTMLAPHIDQHTGVNLPQLSRLGNPSLTKNISENLLPSPHNQNQNLTASNNYVMNWPKETNLSTKKINNLINSRISLNKSIIRKDMYTTCVRRLQDKPPPTVNNE